MQKHHRKQRKLRKSELISPYNTFNKTLSPKAIRVDSNTSPIRINAVRPSMVSPKEKLIPIGRTAQRRVNPMVSPRAKLHNSEAKLSTTASSRSLFQNVRTHRRIEAVEAATSNFSFNSSSNSLLQSSTLRITRDHSTSRRLGKPRQFPITQATALKFHSADLTEHEQSEILDYKQVFFLSSLQFKRPADPELPNNGFDDERGDYLLATGDHLDYRYEVLELLGKGSFGQVVSCVDHKRKKKLALKVIRNKQRFHKQALIEAKILDVLRQRDPADKHHIVRMQSFFLFRNHLCITFELLSINLYELIKLNEFRGFSSGLMRRFAAQILEAMEYFKANSVIHCDLKPENILLCDTKRSEIKVIDFGSSCFDTQTVYTYIQSRFYRSPEIILGIAYTTCIDMWSFGCILAEFCTGVPLFAGENEAEQLQIQMQTLNVPPAHVILRGSRSNLFFDRNLQPIMSTSLPDSKVRTPGSKPLSGIIPDPELCDLVARCLEWDPKKRLTPSSALQHPWLAQNKNITIE